MTTAVLHVTHLVQGKIEARSKAHRSHQPQGVVLEGDHGGQRCADDSLAKVVDAPVTTGRRAKREHYSKKRGQELEQIRAVHGSGQTPRIRSGRVP